MKMYEYWPEAKKNVLLIHPMLASADMMKAYIADKWDGRFHCLIPDLSGNGADQSAEYLSAGEEAERIHDYLLQEGITHIHLAYAASMGGGVLFELLEYKDITFDRLFFEGASFFEESPKAEAIARSLFIFLKNRAIKNPRLISKVIGKIYGSENGSVMTGLLQNMSDKSIANIMHDFCHVKLATMSENLQKRCVFAYGSKDSDKKACLKIQPVRYPYSKVEIWPGYGHCGRPILDSDAYAKMLERILNLD